MTDVPLLSIQMLDRFEALLRRQHAPLSELLQPGLSREQMDLATAPIGLRVPDEAFTWWRWHNGALAEPNQDAREFGPGAFLSLQEAVQEWFVMREIAQDVAGEQADLQWRPEWLPITTRGVDVVCDCSVEVGAPTPIRVVDYHNEPETFTIVRAQSLGEMVSWWIEAIETNALRYDPQSGRWERDDALIAVERLNSRLI